MDLLIKVFTAFAPTTVVIVAAILSWQRLPSKKYMQNTFDSISAELIKLGDKMDAHTQAFHDEMNKHANKIDINSQPIHTEIAKLNDKIDANFQTTQADIRKLNDKVESYSQTTHERIDSASAELRSEIRTMNQNYIDHLARHEDQALKARETQGD